MIFEESGRDMHSMQYVLYVSTIGKVNGVLYHRLNSRQALHGICNV